MLDAPAFCKWLEETYVGGSIRQSLWLFPAIETVHLIGMALLVATITVVDLRLLGWTRRSERMSEVAGRLLPWAWVGFAVQVITGVLLFSSEAVKVYGNPAFRLKLVLIFLAALHALLFRWTVYRNVASWDESSATPLSARISGCISMLLWAGIVTAGRFIGFV